MLVASEDDMPKEKLPNAQEELVNVAPGVFSDEAEDSPEEAADGTEVPEEVEEESEENG
jgi:hypothetical protein